MSKMITRVAVVVLGATLAWPALLWAHARLTRSEPAANARLEVAPTVIRLWFSESPELSLSSITLEDSSGAAIHLGAVRRGDTTLAIEVTILDTLKAGRYTVGWRVAGSDGHPTSGSFAFNSGATVVAADTMRSAVETASASSTEDNPAESLAYVAARAVEFTALLIAMGAAAFRSLVIRRLTLAEAVGRSIDRRLAGAGAIAAVAGLVSAVARLGLQWQILNADAAAARIHLSTMTMETQWGGAWLIQAIALSVAAVAFVIARSGSRPAWALAAIAALVLCATPAMGGHAAAEDHRRVISVAADSVHVLGASIWLGSVFCMLVVAVPIIATQAEDAWQSIASLVNTFSPVALTAAAAVLLTGLLTAWLRLGAIAPLWATGYGRTLLIKLAMLVGVAGAGAYNWKRMRPALGTAEATTRFRKSAAAELVFGAAVIVVTAVLVALPTPVISSH
jgi:putative copper export protein/methionine-rich copper-binding protein CopC